MHQKANPMGKKAVVKNIHLQRIMEKDLKTNLPLRQNHVQDLSLSPHLCFPSSLPLCCAVLASNGGDVRRGWDPLFGAAAAVAAHAFLLQISPSDV